MESKSQDKNPELELSKLRKYVFSEIEKRDWTPAELARRSGVPASKLSNLKNGKNISGTNLYLILKAFGVFGKKKETKEAPASNELNHKYVSLLEKYVNMLEEYEKFKSEILRLKHTKRKDDPEDFDPLKQKRSICNLIC